MADTERFTGRVHIAQPDNQVRNRPVGRDIERDDCRAQDLDRRIEWRRLENQRAHVVFILVAHLPTVCAEHTARVVKSAVEPRSPSSALRRAEAAHGEHEKRTGERDADWPDWYAAYMVAEQAGTELPT